MKKLRYIIHRLGFHNCTEKMKRSRPMFGDRKLLIELEKEYEKKKSNS